MSGINPWGAAVDIQHLLPSTVTITQIHDECDGGATDVTVAGARVKPGARAGAGARAGPGDACDGDVTAWDKLSRAYAECGCDAVSRDCLGTHIERERIRQVCRRWGDFGGGGT